ncbi:hypothetical protein Ato02nite_039770 [Paractinoplanes toevensis]|uniref:Uncharacterized protein n=1 Tax=Paractinoplanes toevensis TaxID=571911 RepID=A0A919TA25_9ACTN|nr:hypothetical protein Ato02nite_039770 [Actinoplanes toevensis]
MSPAAAGVVLVSVIASVPVADCDEPPPPQPPTISERANKDGIIAGFEFMIRRSPAVVTASGFPAGSCLSILEINH